LKEVNEERANVITNEEVAMNLGGWKSWKHSLVSFCGMRMDCFAIDTDRRGEIVIACGGGTTGE
jgi:hypothetical protein